jgi:hypothetical protein
VSKFINIGTKAAAVIGTSLALLSHGQNVKAAVAQHGNILEPVLQRYKGRLKRQLVLKLNLYRPADSRMVSHSSHSSHESHASHSSHSSGGYSNDSDNGGSGLGLGALVVGGVVAYGLYRAAKKKNN